MPTITAVVHTKNSQRTLENCLRSLTWCDECMVVDMESSDATLSIAARYTTKIYKVNNTDAKGNPIRIVEEVRNHFLKKVTTDWTFIVDSDEEVPDTLARHIQTIIADPTYQGYSLPRKNIIFGQWIEHTGFWPDYIIRLFKTGTGKHPTVIHQQLEVHGQIATLPPKEELALVHHHYTSIEEFISRLNTYTSYEAKKYEQSPDTALRFSSGYITTFFDQFFSRFFSQQGYKDGMHGLILSLLMGVYTMVVQMKVWEITKKEKTISLDSIETEVASSCSATSYWVANEQLAHETNILKKVSLMVRRKVSA